MALVQPMNIVTVNPGSIEADLGIYRLKGKQRAESRFVPLRSVVRGAFLVPARVEQSEDYLAVDTVDSDMFARMLDMRRARSS